MTFAFDEIVLKYLYESNYGNIFGNVVSTMLFLVIANLCSIGKLKK